MQGQRTQPDSQPRPAVRRGVHVFIGLVALCALASIEFWPFTGWRLYSQVRTRYRDSWSIVAVQENGAEQVVFLDDLPVGFRNTTTLLNDFDSMADDERDAVCDAWAGPLRAEGTPVVLVRVDQVRTDLAEPEAEPTRTPAYRCGTSP